MTPSPKWHLSLLTTSTHLPKILEQLADAEVFNLEINPFKDNDTRRPSAKPNGIAKRGTKGDALEYWIKRSPRPMSIQTLKGLMEDAQLSPTNIYRDLDRLVEQGRVKRNSAGEYVGGKNG